MPSVPLPAIDVAGWPVPCDRQNEPETHSALMSQRSPTGM